MAKGLSFHIGLNLINPDHYSGWDGALKACENDAIDMDKLAKTAGFKTTLVLSRDGTRNALLSFLKKAADELESGDMFFITYSGHGGQVRDVSGDEVMDRIDETWCLYDGQIIDDELYKLYGAFKSGVRGLVLSDSCHSGTVLKMHLNKLAITSLGQSADIDVFARKTGSEAPRIKAMPRNVAIATYDANKQFYDGLAADISAKGKSAHQGEVEASIRLISGCQDNQYSLDGGFNRNSAFTEQLLDVWSSGNFRGDYNQFHSAILDGMPPTQSPNHFKIGVSDPEFDQQKPFTI